MASNIDGLPPISALPIFQRIVKKDGAELQEKFAKQKTVQKEIDYFTEKVKKLKEPEDLFKDRRLMQFVLSAFSMDDEIDYMGRMKKILLSKTADEDSLASKMADPRFREINKGLLIGDMGVGFLKTNTKIEELTKRYIQNEYEKDLGKQNPALREASYFLRKIGTINNSLDILGDKILRSVTTYTLGLPDEIALQSISRQRQLIDKRIDVSKFKVGSGTSTTITSEKANADVTAIDAKLRVVSTAATQVKTILDRLQDIKDGYDRLAHIQDPSGPFAGEIPVQEAAIPELVRMRGLMGAAAPATNVISGAIERMGELIDLAKDPANAGSLSSYKVEFEAMRAEAHTALGQATYIYDDTDGDAVGTAQNLLDGSLAGPISVQYKSTGETIELRTHNFTGLLSSLDAANTAFQAVTGAGDAANLGAAEGSINSSGTALDSAKQAMKTDENAFLAAMGSIPQFAAALNTDELYPGFLSAASAGTRAAKVIGLLGQVRGLAVQSAARGAGDDRSDLNTRYSELLAELNTEINTVGPGLDNLLAGGNQSYELINSAYATVRGRDLNASVLATLTSSDVTSGANANALLSAFSSTIDPAMAQTQRELAADITGIQLAASRLDSRSSVDSAYQKLATDMKKLVADATVDKQSLLSATQSDITLKVATSGHTVTIKARTTFDADVTQVIAAGAALLPSGVGDPTGALAKLDEAMFNVRRHLSALNSDARNLNLERNTAKAAGNAASVSEGTKGSSGIDAADFTIKFIMRFLAKKDSEATAPGTSMMGSLIYPIGIGPQKQGSGIGFIAIGDGMNFLV